MKGVPLAWIIFSVMCSSVGHFALKLGAMRISAEPVADSARLGMITWLVSGAALQAIALVLWVVGLRRVALTVAYPFIGLGFVLVSVLSWIFLKEAVTPARAMGMMLIGAGVILVSRT